MTNVAPRWKLVVNHVSETVEWRHTQIAEWMLKSFIITSLVGFEVFFSTFFLNRVACSEILVQDGTDKIIVVASSTNSLYSGH